MENGHKRHVLDIYTPEEPGGRSLPVMFWIHGGGLQAGDKNDVVLKPKALTERGFVFVSTNYRLLPEVEMGELIGDVASATSPTGRTRETLEHPMFRRRLRNAVNWCLRR